MVQSAIDRVLQRNWEGAPLRRRPKRFMMVMHVDDQPLNLQGPARVMTRPSEITPELLARKGLL